MSVPIYVASRASIPERSAKWRELRESGVNITSSWIDEAGPGETTSFEELWDRIQAEIMRSVGVLLYAEPGDFPLKGALIEAGMSLGMLKPVVVCLPHVNLEGASCRPIGSWIKHRRVIRCDVVEQAIGILVNSPKFGADLPSSFDHRLCSDDISPPPYGDK